jgi:hypothetical protein
VGVANLARYLSYIDKSLPLKNKETLDLAIQVKFELLQQVGMDILKDCIEEDLNITNCNEIDLLIVKIRQLKYYIDNFYQFINEKSLVNDIVFLIKHPEAKVRLETSLLIRNYLEYVQARGIQTNAELWKYVNSNIQQNDQDSLHGVLLLIQELFKAENKGEGPDNYINIVTLLMKLLKNSKPGVLRKAILDAISESAHCDRELFARSFFDTWLETISKQFSSTWSETMMIIENVGQTCEFLGKLVSMKIDALIQLYDEAFYNSKISQAEQEIVLDSFMKFSSACKESLNPYLAKTLQRMYDSFDLSLALMDCFVQLCNNCRIKYFPLHRQLLIRAKMLLNSERESDLILGFEILSRFKFPFPVLSSELAPLILKYLKPQKSTSSLNFFAAKSVISLSSNVHKGIMVEIEFAPFIKPLADVMPKFGEIEKKKLAIALLNACKEDATVLLYDQDPFISLLLECPESNSDIFSKFNRINLAPKFRRVYLKLQNSLKLEEISEISTASQILFKFPNSYWIPYCKSLLNTISQILGSCLPDEVRHLLSLIEKIIICDPRMASSSLFENLLTILQENRDYQVKSSVLNLMHVFLSFGKRELLQQRLSIEAMRIITNLYKIELNGEIKLLMMRVMGFIGAVDPIRLKLQELVEVERYDLRPAVDESAVIQNLKDELFFPSYVLECLKRIQVDQSLEDYHSQSFQAICYTLRSLGTAVPKEIDRMMPILLQSIQTDSLIFATKELYLQELGSLIHVVGVHIRKYLKSLMDFWESCWKTQPVPYIPCLLFLESLSKVLSGELGNYSNSIISNILSFVKRNLETMYYAVQVGLEILLNLNFLLEPFIDDVDAIIASIIENDTFPKSLHNIAIELAHGLNSFHCSNSKNLNLRKEPEEFVEDELSIHSFHEEFAGKLTLASVSSYSLKTNIDNLREAWKYMGKDRIDWREWLKQLCLEFIRESPSPAIRSCSLLSSSYIPLQRKLFNVAFASIWLQMDALEKGDFLNNLEKVLSSNDIPSELIQVFLDLVEFMDHEEFPLNLDRGLLGTFAVKVHAFAKALYYREGDFKERPGSALVENLISINNQLQQIDSAHGIVSLASKDYDISIKETWYEKLQKWTDALESYEKILAKSVNKEMALGALRCYHALGEWKNFDKLLAEYWPLVEEHSPLRQSFVIIACATFWASGRVSKIDDYISYLPPDQAEGNFFRSLLAFSKKEYEECRRYIERTRRIIEPELKALLQESYSRAYNVIIRTQMLSELEEAIELKNWSHRRNLIISNWIQRYFSDFINISKDWNLPREY